MGYSDYKASNAYKSRMSGAAIQIVLVDLSTGKQFRAGHTGITPSSNIEQIPTRQAGNSGVDEIVTGAMESTLSVEGLFTADANDNEVPNDRDFINREFDVFQVIGAGRSGEGNVLNFCHGFKPANVNSGAHGNGGVVPFSMSGPVLYRLTGQQYADQYGAN